MSDDALIILIDALIILTDALICFNDAQTYKHMPKYVQRCTKIKMDALL